MILGLFRSKPRLVKVKKRKKTKKAPKPRARVRKTKIKRPKRKVSRAVKKMPRIVGKITHYFPHVKAGVILVANEKIALGDTLQIKGHTTDFKQKITSMQINNAPIKEAKPGEEIGVLLKRRVRHNDVVYKL